MITGVYKHYKGKHYMVLGEAIHSETNEKMIVYKAIYGEELTFVRPYTMFFEKIDVEGVLTPRFKFIEHS